MKPVNLKAAVRFVTSLMAIFALSAFIPDGTTMEIAKLKNTSFKHGERLVYKAYYTASFLYVPAGEVTFDATLEQYNNKPAYHLSGFGQTYKSYDWFFKVRDKYESYVDTSTMLPLKFLRDVNEGGYKIYNNVSFLRESNKAISTHGVYKVPTNIHDIMSAVYMARNIDYSRLKPNDKLTFSFFIDDQVYPMYIRYIGRENVILRDGSQFKCIKFRPNLIKGALFKGGEAMTIWVTDDKNRIPVRIESEVSVGRVRADIISWQGLLNPMSAKLK